jgi:hypothetical protein
MLMTTTVTTRTIIAPLLALTAALALGGCKSEQERAEEKRVQQEKESKAAVINAERQVDEAAKKMGQAAAQLGESAAHLGAQGAAAGIEGASAGMAAAAAGLQNVVGAMNGAVAGGANVGKVPLVDFRSLKALLPDSVAGLARKSAGGEKSGAMGLGVSQASGVYAGGEGARIDVKLTDAGAMGAMFGAIGLSGLEIDKENEDGFERTTTLAGRKALEKYDNKAKHGEIKIFVGGRYIVEVDGQDVPPESLKKAVAALNLGKLETLK